MVADAHVGHVVEVDVAEDAAHAEHILTLQVGAVAPAEHLYGQAVLAAAQMVGQVELRHVVGALGITYVFTVEPYERSTVDAAEMNQRAAALPSLGQGEGAYIAAHRIDAVVGTAVIKSRTSLDERRSVGVRVLNVGIDGTVVALHLPVGGNGNRIPAAHVVVRLVEVRGALRGLAHKVEAPSTVEVEITIVDRRGPRCVVVGTVGQHSGFTLVGHVGSYGRFFVFGKDCFVFPVGRLDFRLLHGLEGQPCCGIGGIIGHRFELSAAQGIHLFLFAGQLGGTPQDVRVGMSLHRFEVEACIVPLSHGGGPLQQVVDAGVVAAIVEVLSVESILYGKGEQVDGLDVPVLPTVVRVDGFGHDAGIVFA